MKRILTLLLVLALCLSCLAACANGPEPTTPPTTGVPTTGTPTTPTTEPESVWADYEIITIAKALELCEQFAEAPSEERYYISGTIVEVQNSQYGQLLIKDDTGSITVYGSYSADGSQRYDQMDKKPAVGDVVLLHGTLQNYNGSTKEIQNGRIIDFISNAGNQPDPELPEFDTELTIAQILALPLTDGQVTEGRYLVRGTVDSVTNAQYGAMVITDGTDTITVYGSYSADGSVGYAQMESKPVKGDTVLLYTNVKNFGGKLELNSAWIREFTAGEFDESAYTSMTIAEARTQEESKQIMVEGTVACITYANGMKPSGVILVDATDSIYIYDADLAGRVAVGNRVRVAASKTMWVLDSETGNASKFGYQGCNQLENAWLLENDGKTQDFDRSWIQEISVKELLDTPVTQDITTHLFRVTALVREEPGNGFTNYYFYDLDGKTGSYAYTQCNGNDFEWLRAYDGKIVTVYLMALNAKSTASDCYWRLLPVAVQDDGFDPSKVDVNALTLRCLALTQFQSEYTGDPALELLAKADLPLLNISGVKLRYTSDNTNVIRIDGNVMHCLATGTANITVEASYGGKSAKASVSVSVKIADASGSYASVSDAISTAVGEKVTVQGIVGPSLVNQTGFYLIDESGVIAVLTTADVLQTLQPGNMVVLEAERYFKCKDGSTYGQTCLRDATVVANLYGSHSYSDAAFQGSISVEDFYNLDIEKDFTTHVYTMRATVLVEGTSYSKNIYLTDGTTKVRLYCSSANQYQWLQAYDGQEVTVEIAPCNWNSKNYYTGCALAVVADDGSKVINTLNFEG